MSRRCEDLLFRLTLDEKVDLVTGLDMWHTRPVEHLGIPSMKVTDGPNGARGPVAPGTYPSLASFPTTGLSFGQHVMPVLKSRCKACHMPGSAQPLTKYGSTTFDYSGGLDLSAYEKDAASAKGILDLVNTVVPTASQLLAKPMIGSKHAGGAFWNVGDAEHEAIRQWIAEGAKNN